MSLDTDVKQFLSLKYSATIMYSTMLEKKPARDTSAHAYKTNVHLYTCSIMIKIFYD